MNIYHFLDSAGRSLDYVKVSKYFTLGEFRKSSFCTHDETITQIPIPQNLLYAMDYIRENLGKPVSINSHFRTVKHELSQGRSGRSQHTMGKAVDLSGNGIVDFIADAIKTKNRHYIALRNFGVNAVGLYDTFVHIDVRAPKVLGGLYFWNNRGKFNSKKKDDDDAPIDWLKLGIIGVALYYMIKKIF